MRRFFPLILLPALTGCTGFGTFLDHTFSLPGEDPNVPMTDSENFRRALGQSPVIQPLETEPGNVWPRFDYHEPTLEDVERSRGGQQPQAQTPTRRQPRTQRGSSTPPGNAQPAPAQLPDINAPPPIPPPNTSARPGGVVNTPEGPGVDTGGTNSYRQLNTPRGPGAIVVPNGNGTSTVINPDGTVQTIPTPR